MHVLVITKSGHASEALVDRLRAHGHGVTIAARSPEVARLIRELPVGAILVESARGASAEEFRRQVTRLRPECRVVFVPDLDIDAARAGLRPTGPDEIVIHQDDLALILDQSAPGGAPAPAADAARVRALVQALDVVVSFIEADDPYFAGFSHRVAELSGRVAAALGLAPEVAEAIEIGALLHDLGKTAIEPALLQHGETFQGPEAAKMQEHVHWSCRLLEHIEFPWRVREIVRHHHERYDGTGYPDGLRGRAIPIGARIIAAVDTYVAIVSHRRHRPALSFDDAREELTRSAGSQLDPEVVESLLKIASAPSNRSSAGERARIVFVDPDTVFQRLFRLRLMAEGLEVESRPGVEGLAALLRAGGVSLVVVDTSLAGLGAVDAARAEAAAAGLPDVPIAALAREDDRRLRLDCLGHGIEDFLLKSSDLEDLVARIRNVLLRERRRVHRDDPAGEEAGLAGTLEAMSLPDIAQFLALGQKSARVTLTTPGESGEIWMEAGRVVHAACGTETGEAAFHRMVGWREGRFRINHGVAPPAHSIDVDTMGLVLEGLRLHDEASAGFDA